MTWRLEELERLALFWAGRRTANWRRAEGKMVWRIAEWEGAGHDEGANGLSVKSMYLRPMMHDILNKIKSIIPNYCNVRFFCLNYYLEIQLTVFCKWHDNEMVQCRDDELFPFSYTTLINLYPVSSFLCYIPALY